MRWLLTHVRQLDIAWPVVPVVVKIIAHLGTVLIPAIKVVRLGWVPVGVDQWMASHPDEVILPVWFVQADPSVMVQQSFNKIVLALAGDGGRIGAHVVAFPFCIPPGGFTFRDFVA